MRSILSDYVIVGTVKLSIVRTIIIDFTNENDRFYELNFRQYKLNYQRSVTVDFEWLHKDALLYMHLYATTICFSISII